MVTRFGMSERGSIALGRQQGNMFLGGILQQSDFSEETAAAIDDEVRQLVDVAYGVPKRCW